MLLLLVTLLITSHSVLSVDYDTERLHKFAEYTAERLNEKLNTGGRFQDFKNAFKDVEVCSYRSPLSSSLNFLLGRNNWSLLDKTVP